MNFAKALFIATLPFVTPLAMAEEPTKLFGKWTQQGASGPVVWEFTRATIGFTPFDSVGKAIAPENKATISYRPIGDSWVIEFKTPDGKPGGGLMAVFKDADTVVIDDPGQRALVLKRVRN